MSETKAPRKIENPWFFLSEEYLRINDETIQLQDIIGAEYTEYHTEFDMVGSVKVIYLWYRDKTLVFAPKDIDTFMEDLAEKMEAYNIKIEKKMRKSKDKSRLWRIDTGKKHATNVSLFHYLGNTVFFSLFCSVLTAVLFSRVIQPLPPLSKSDAFLWILNPVLVGMLSVLYLQTAQPYERKAVGLKLGVACAATMLLLALVLSNTIYPEASFFYTSPLAVLYYAETLLIPVVVGRLGDHY